METEYLLKLNQQDLVVLNECLLQGVYIRVAPLIEKINQQLTEKDHNGPLSNQAED
jgi:hypothetical protein